MKIGLNISVLTVLTTTIALTGCATNDELFAKYDKSCDLPQTRIKIVEKVKLVDKVKVVHQTKYVDRIKYIPKVEYRGISGMNWEPAVYFGHDESTLSSKAHQRLDTDILVLKKNPKMKINIQAFTDQSGSSRYNSRLSVSRQNQVVSYLVGQGVSRNRIVVSALGEALPLINNGVEKQLMNRRVELMLLDPSNKPVALKVSL